jgi:hypothetical protein
MQRAAVPILDFATVGPTQTTGSHFHDGYGMLMITNGEYQVTGTMCGTGTVTMTEPRHASGECIPGPLGAKEIIFFESGHAAIPFFKDKSDPRVVALFESSPGFKAYAP